MERLTLEQIKERIDNYVANGGSIYDSRRQLPYYSVLNKLVAKIRRGGKPDFNMVDAYKLMGYDFDKEYYLYTQLVEQLGTYADENNFVDSLKGIGGPKSTETLLKRMASTIPCSPSDYLILMTDYRYQNAIIATDYIAELGRQLKEAYPTGDVRNIRRENSQLYEKLRHVCGYSTKRGTNNMQSIAEFYGLKNDKFSDVSVYQNLNPFDIIDQIKKEYPDGDLTGLPHTNPALYYKANECAVSENKTFKQWCDEHSFIYSDPQNTSRFSKMKVDAAKREKQLFDIRKKFEGNPPQLRDKKEEYYYNKHFAKIVINELEYIK